MATVGSATGFHAGELEVQRRAGLDGQASQLRGMLAPPHLTENVVRFLARREFVILSARDGDGRLWVTAVEGPQGFLDAGPDWLSVHGAPPAGDPLGGLAAGQPIGLIAMEFATRKRFRMNGTLAVAADDSLGITLDQAYGNCPKYIHPREVHLREAPAGTASVAAVAAVLSPDQEAVIRSADTFFLGSTHPERGNDASHRGGPAGFVEVRDGELWWPDFVGNSMFNTFGNLAVDDSAALWFADWTTGRTVHLSGRATVEWDQPTQTGRAVRFVIEAVRNGAPLRNREP